MAGVEDNEQESNRRELEEVACAEHGFGGLVHWQPPHCGARTTQPSACCAMHDPSPLGRGWGRGWE